VTAPPAVREALARFRAALEARYGSALVELRLYGSYARGDATEDSDVDVYVLLEQASAADKLEVLELAGRVFHDTGLMVSPTLAGRAQLAEWRRLGHPLWNAIEEEGVPA
jgi:predicted nucleotidyltransferase